MSSYLQGDPIRMKTAIDYSAYLIVRAFLSVVQALPMSTCERISDQLGKLCWHILRLRRSVVEENLKTAFPDLSEEKRDKIALGMWQHLFLMVMEIAHAPRKVHRTNWKDHSSIADTSEVLRCLIDERPTIIICGHLGNFEMGGVLVALHGFPTHTIARPLDNPYLDRFFNSFRQSTGQYMLPKQGSSQEIEEVLNEGGVLGLLGDQDAGVRGCWTDFFGRPASTHKAVGLFTLSSQAPTFVCASVRQGPMKFEMQVSEVIDPQQEGFQYGSVPSLIEWYSRHLENLISKSPTQYWWVHRRWKPRPATRKTRRQREHSAQAA